MAVGINDDKINQVKVDLLTYIETINAISERLDSCSLAISSCIDGNGKQEIEKKLNSIIRQMPRVSSNINSTSLKGQLLGLTDLHSLLNQVSIFAISPL